MWLGPPVWFHGDVARGNLLVHGGRLAAVIDFGCSGVGDPACDLVLAWTLLPRTARPAYAQTLGLDHDTWARARGWALWKALTTVVGQREHDPITAEEGPASDQRGARRSDLLIGATRRQTELLRWTCSGLSVLLGL